MCLVGGVYALTGIVSITSQNADIVDAGDLQVDVVATALRLNAGGAIGELGVGVNPVDVTAPVISAVAGTGINVLAAGDVVIDSVANTTDRVLVDGTTTPILIAPQADIVTETGGVVLVTQPGH